MLRIHQLNCHRNKIWRMKWNLIGRWPQRDICGRLRLHQRLLTSRPQVGQRVCGRSFLWRWQLSWAITQTASCDIINNNDKSSCFCFIDTLQVDDVSVNPQSSASLIGQHRRLTRSSNQSLLMFTWKFRRKPVSEPLSGRSQILTNPEGRPLIQAESRCPPSRLCPPAVYKPHDGWADWLILLQSHVC